jgi:hypothetical protein
MTANKIVLYNSRSYLVKMTVLGFVLTVASLLTLKIDYVPISQSWTLSFGPDIARILNHLTSWGCFLFFALCTVLCAKKAIDKTPRLIIDDNGIGYGNATVIPWTEIDGAYVESIGRQTFIRLQLRDGMTNAANEILPVNKIGLSIVASPISRLNLSGLNVDPDEICKVIVTRAEEVRKSNEPPNAKDARA